ncbi:TPA: DUF3077 domain-containing protein [Pseudomonas aeruginosa]|nr:DUF3077 domain-containing protein [Pseudomonas aeruginosa]ERX91930.1 hypothetical protein Q079_04073 [Pseudomonas aeruginosa BL25]TEC05109.1 DUF3077 domain-containing protein [Pseudomonas aeruginosa]
MKPTDQLTALTALNEFESLGGGRYLLQVRSGVPVGEALDSASCRLSEVIEFLREQSVDEQGLSQNSLYLVWFLVENVKAVVDAANLGVLR